MANFTVFESGAPATWDRWLFKHPRLPTKGKSFLREHLGLTGMEVSVNSFPPGATMPFVHRHRVNEELYLFLSGTGEFRVDDAIFPVGEGTVVRVAPGGHRVYRNTGTTPLVFLVVQAPAGKMDTATVEDGMRVEEPLGFPPAATTA
ncbi:MAG: cupin domain-containing protein [Myxococcota bacterium]